MRTVDFCMSQAPVGQRSAQSPQCTQRSSSFTITRPVCGKSSETYRSCVRFSAEVSSADAILFMLATSLSQDLYRRFVRPGASDAQVLRVARLAAVAGGVLGTGLAVAAESIAGVLSFFYTLLTVSLFVPVMAGLYVRRVGTAEALASLAGGVALATLVQVTTAGAGIAGLTPAMCGLGGAALACGAAALVRPPRP